MWFWKKNIKPEIPAQKVDEKYKVYLPKLWPYRFIGNLCLLGLIAAISFGIYVAKTNFVEQKLDTFSNYFIDITSQIGFTVDDVIIQGRDKTPLEDIKNIINLANNNNIFNLDIHQIKQDILLLPWVKTVVIERSYFPNNINIKITEKEISAIWQTNNSFYPVDKDGFVIKTHHIPVVPTLIITGKGAPENINKLLPIIQEDDSLYKRIKAASYISERRWDIVLDDIENGVTIRLPAEKTKTAWKKLIKLSKTQGLLKRKLTIIDLRFGNKVVVTPLKLSKEERLRRRNIKEHKL